MGRIGEAERLAKIAEVFTKHGVGYLIGRRKVEEEREAGTRRAKARSLRRAFEDLGPSFMKLGQLLSNRPDVIAREYVEEFSKLRRKAPMVPIEEVREVVERELGPLDEVFDDFDEEAIAAASIGQVHRASVGGEDIIVKVQRPGIRAAVERDFEIFRDFLGFFRTIMMEDLPMEPVEIVDALERDMEKQLDYTVEGRNCERIRRNLRTVDGIEAPRIKWELTTDKVLVEKYVEGEVLDDVIDRGELDRYDRAEMARTFVRGYFKMIFEDGFFHADPHPANIILSGSTIFLIDFGSAGRLTETLRVRSLAFYLAVVEDYPDLATDALLEMSRSEGEVDRSSLEWDLEEISDLMYLPMGTAFVTSGLSEVLGEHGLKVPREFVLVDRSLDALTGIAMSVYPDFSLRQLLEPYGQELMQKEFGLGGAVERGFQKILEMEESLTDLPRVFDQAAESLAEGEMKVNFEHGGFQELIAEIDRATSRLSYTLVISSIVLASSILTLEGFGPSYRGVPMVGITGFVLAAAMGLGLLFSIWRGGGRV